MASSEASGGKRTITVETVRFLVAGRCDRRRALRDRRTHAAPHVGIADHEADCREGWRIAAYPQHAARRIPLRRNDGIHVSRKAVPEDVPRSRALIDASVRELQAGDYTPAQIEESLRSVYGVDTQLIADGTYFVVESGRHNRGLRRVEQAQDAVRRRSIPRAGRFAARAARAMRPRIRAFFVHPQWARRGIGALLLEACESAAIAAGFTAAAKWARP